MNWEAIGIIAESVSAFAVVVTLVFLIVELRNNRNATQSAAVDAAATGFNSMNSAIITEPGFMDLFIRSQSGDDSLSRSDRARVQLLMQSYINHFTTLKKYHESGALPDSDWRHYAVAMAALTNSVGGKKLSQTIEIPERLREELESFRGKETPYGWDESPE